MHGVKWTSCILYERVQVLLSWVVLKNHKYLISIVAQSQWEIDLHHICMYVHVRGCGRNLVELLVWLDICIIMHRLNPASFWVTGYDPGGHSYHPRPEGDMNWPLGWYPVTQKEAGVVIHCDLLSFSINHILENVSIAQDILENMNPSRVPWVVQDIMTIHLLWCSQLWLVCLHLTSQHLGSLDPQLLLLQQLMS